MKKPRIFIISGPGGAGKTTIVNKLLENEKIKASFIKGITVTTRGQRPKEVEGKDYFFVKEEEFLRLKKKRFFLENQKVLDNHYGTPKLFYSIAKAKNKGLVLVIDVKGGTYLKENIKDGKVITIFLAAPNEKELYKRMEKRSESQKIMKQRIELAKKELQFSKCYDYLVTNKTIVKTVKELRHILLNNN